MAVIGAVYAVLQTGILHLKRVLAWLVWAGIHIQFLAVANLRLSVFLQWVWLCLTGQRGSRLIVDHHRSECRDPGTADAMLAAVNSSNVQNSESRVQGETRPPMHTLPGKEAESASRACQECLFRHRNEDSLNMGHCRGSGGSQ